MEIALSIKLETQEIESIEMQWNVYQLKMTNKVDFWLSSVVYCQQSETAHTVWFLGNKETNKTM